MAEKKEKAETTVRRIRRKTRKKYSAEDKIRIVIEGLRGDMSVATALELATPIAVKLQQDPLKT